MSRFFKYLSHEKNWLLREGLGFVSMFSGILFWNRNVMSFALTKGQSMEPTIQDGDVVLVDHFFYRKFKRFRLKQDDIITAKCSFTSDYMCKRVTGFPGDTKQIIVPANHNI